MRWFTVIGALLCTRVGVHTAPCSFVDIVHSWSMGFKAVAKIQMDETVDHWDMAIQFSENVIKLEAWRGTVTKISSMDYNLSNKCFNSKLYSCQCLELPFLVRHQPHWTGNISVTFNGLLTQPCAWDQCRANSSGPIEMTTTYTTTTTTTTTNTTTTTASTTPTTTLTTTTITTITTTSNTTTTTTPTTPTTTTTVISTTPTTTTTITTITAGTTTTTTTPTTPTTVCTAGEINPTSCTCVSPGSYSGEVCTPNQGCTLNGTCLNVCPRGTDSALQADCFCQTNIYNEYEGELCRAGKRCIWGNCACMENEISPDNCVCLNCLGTVGEVCTANQGCTSRGSCLDVCTPGPDSVQNDCFCETVNNKGGGCSPRERCYNGTCECPYIDSGPECYYFTHYKAKQSLCHYDGMVVHWEDQEKYNTIVGLMQTECAKTCFCGNFIDLECAYIQPNWCFWLYLDYLNPNCDNVSCNDSGKWCKIWNNICKRMLAPFCNGGGRDTLYD